MNLKEINQNEDDGLRKIRLKYWNLRHKAFLDEQHISDHELNQYLDESIEDEEKEISEYLRGKSAN